MSGIDAFLTERGLIFIAKPLVSGGFRPVFGGLQHIYHSRAVLDGLVDGMASPNAFVPEPALALQDGTPVSQAFEDVYFSRDGGIAETEYVFIQNNGLPERWQGRSRFTIAELGFGTGLNFLVALKQFRASAPSDATLHYMGYERFPFKRKALSAVLDLQPELADEAAELLAAYPLRLPGIIAFTSIVWC